MTPQAQAIMDQLVAIEQAIAVGGFPLPANIAFSQDLTNLKIALSSFDTHLTNYMATGNVNQAPVVSNQAQVVG